VTWLNATRDSGFESRPCRRSMEGPLVGDKRIADPHPAPHLTPVQKSAGLLDEPSSVSEPDGSSSSQECHAQPVLPSGAGVAEIRGGVGKSAVSSSAPSDPSAGELERRPDTHSVHVKHLNVTALPYATDAGETCHRCGQVVTWVDHLPPTRTGMPVRCFTSGGDEPSCAPVPLLASPPVSIRLNASMLELQSDALKTKAVVAYDKEGDDRKAAHLAVAARLAADAAQVLRNYERGRDAR